MKNVLRIFMLVALASSTLLVGCKDDEVEPSVEEMLLGSWMGTSATLSPGMDLDGDGNIDTDLWAFLVPLCTQDDITTYMSNKTYTVDEGATKCEPGDPQISDEGTWSLNSEMTEITVIDSDTLTEVMGIISISETTMKLSTTHPFFPGQTITGTFAKQ